MEQENQQSQNNNTSYFGDDLFPSGDELLGLGLRRGPRPLLLGRGDEHLGVREELQAVLGGAVSRQTAPQPPPRREEADARRRVEVEAVAEAAKGLDPKTGFQALPGKKSK